MKSAWGGNTATLLSAFCFFNLFAINYEVSRAPNLPALYYSLGKLGYLRVAGHPAAESQATRCCCRINISLLLTIPYSLFPP
ncbi:MAG: hypothetical protein AAF915_21880, partial [Cyanobacteria bacterium P01_D01_bin.50]